MKKGVEAVGGIAVFIIKKMIQAFFALTVGLILWAIKEM